MHTIEAYFKITTTMCFHMYMEFIFIKNKF